MVGNGRELIAMLKRPLFGVAEQACNVLVCDEERKRRIVVRFLLRVHTVRVVPPAWLLLILVFALPDDLQHAVEVLTDLFGIDARA